MSYPFWDVPIGYGVLMAIIAVVHVFVSHFAIGGGLYLIVMERRARQANDEDRLAFLRRLSKGFVLISVVFGALTGVAIWFIIGLLNPSATEVLIHNFVWAWAIEWTFFAIEIAAALLYYYGWERMSAKGHMALGWIYFISAWLSLVVINGIVAFMLTPGAWLETGNFWDGFLNPTYWPALVFRTAVCIFLAGIFALWFASTTKGSGVLKSRLVRSNTTWAVVGLIGAAASWIWYRAAIPTDVMDIAIQRLAIAERALETGTALTVVLLVLLVVFGWLLPRAYRPVLAVVVMALGLAWFGSFEWFRESTRKPYAVYGYMYGNGIRADQIETFKKDGLLAHARFRTGDDGADLFRYACRTCHTLFSYNPVLPAFAGTDEAFVGGTIEALHELKGKMPPFPGSSRERDTLAAWIWKHADQRPFEEVYPALEGQALGEKVYAVRCGRCHVRGGFKDNHDTLAGGDQELIEEILDDDEFAEGMPAFTGSDKERQALIEYLMTWKQEGEE